MGDDIEDFIREQKSKIAKERQNLDGRQYPDHNGYKENIPPRGQTPEVPLVAKMVPSAENDRRRKLREERNQEYNDLLKKQRARETGRNGLDGEEGGAVIPGIEDRNSAKQRKVVERNREYNEFLEQQKNRERHRFDKAKGTSEKSQPPPDPPRQPPPQAREPDRSERERRLDEYDRQRETHRRRQTRDYDEPLRGRRDDDDFDRRPPSPRPRPDEDEGMSLPLKDRGSAKRRAEEQRNKEYNEYLEKKKGGRGVRKGWGTPTYDEILDEKRKREREYRRYDDPEVVYGRPMRASYSDGHLNKSFEEERLDQLDKDLEARKVRFKSEVQKPPGRGILDDRDWLDPYRAPRSSRYDPDREFQEWDRNLGDNRQRLPTAGNVEAISRPAANFNDKRQRITSAPLDGNGLPLGNEAPESIARRKEQYRRELEQQMQEAANNKRRERRDELRVNATGEVDIPHRDQLRAATLGDINPISPRSIRRDVQPSYNTAPVPSAYLQNQPQLGPYNTPGDESYHYYGMVDPLSLEPARSNAPFLQQFSGTPALIPLGPGRGHPAVPPINVSDRAPRVTFEDSGEMTRTTPRKGKYDSDMVSAAIPTVDDRDQEKEKRAKAAEYSRELERQMQEQKMKKLREKAEKEAYDRKLEDEIRNYNPFGRGGGGAPLKDSTGNVVADLRGRNGPDAVVGGGGQIATTPRAMNPDPSYLTPRGTDSEPTHARGGHGIFGAPKTDAEKDATDKYKEELRLQIEEKKRREDERRRLEREEEEREQRKIEEEQRRMKEEYEAELQKQRDKDEEARRKNEELKKAAEEKRLELERQRREEDEKRSEELRRKQEEERLAREREQQQRGNSPAVPALRKDSSSRIDRTGSATILTELEKMRKQLQNERNRVESSLQKDKYTIDVSDPRLAKVRPMPLSSQPPVVPTTIQHPISPRDVDIPGRKIDFDIFDAAIKNRVPATVRRPPLAGDEVHPEVLDEFQKHKNKRTSSRQNFRNDFPDQPTSGFILEAQQLALLRDQEDELNKLRRKPFDDAFVDDLNMIPPMGDMGSKSQLQSDSAFIDMDGLPVNPNDYERAGSRGSRNPSARDRRRYRESPKPSGTRQPDTTSLGSTTSLDPERIKKKNEDRLQRLNDMADDETSPVPAKNPPKKKPVGKQAPVERGTSPIRKPAPKRTPPRPKKPLSLTPAPRRSSNGPPPKLPPRPAPKKAPQTTPPPALPPPRRTPRRFSPRRYPSPPARQSYSKSPDRSHPATMASPYRSKNTPRKNPSPDSRYGHGGDDVSSQDPDDIIDRFIAKQQHNRPPSGTTLDDEDEAWLKPSK